MSNKNTGKENRFMYIKMIKRRLLSVIAALVFLLALSGCGAAEKEGSVYMNINAEKAKEMMDGLEKFVILDFLFKNLF